MSDAGTASARSGDKRKRKAKQEAPAEEGGSSDAPSPAKAQRAEKKAKKQKTKYSKYLDPEKERRKRIKVLFLHGLESGPTGTKARFLGQVFSCTSPDMTPIIRRMITYESPYIQSMVISAAFIIAISVYMIYYAISQAQWPYIAVAVVLILAELLLLRYLWQVNVQACVDGCCDMITGVISTNQPDIIVASSFGGGIAVHLLTRGTWHGLTLLLAPAQHAIARRGLLSRTHAFSLPLDANVTIVHGNQDNVVPLEDSRTLAGLAPVRDRMSLIEVDDEHRLLKYLTKSRLEELVVDMVRRGSSSEAHPDHVSLEVSSSTDASRGASPLLGVSK